MGWRLRRAIEQPRRRALTLIALLGCGAGVWLARRAPARGAITGQVTNRAGRPLAGAQVCAYGRGRAIAGLAADRAICATTGADGHYRLRSLVPASYRLAASARAFSPAPRDPVSVRAGQVSTGEDFALRPGGAEVFGQVRDGAGHPVAGAEVWISPEGADLGWTVTWTGRDGAFRTWGAAGEVRAVATAAGYVTGEITGAEGARLAIPVIPGSTIEGRVLDAAGRPVPGARVGAPPGFGPGAAPSAISGPDGRFQLTRLPPDRYHLDAVGPAGRGHAAHSVVVGIGETAAIDIALRPAATVSGAIRVDGDAPCRDGGISLDSGLDSYHGRTEPDGRIEIDGVAPGTYEVSVRCEGARSRDAYPAVVVANGAPTTGVIWDVDRGAMIGGLVTTPDGEPVSGAWMHVEGARVRTFGVATGPDGRFEIAGLPAGRLDVMGWLDGGDLPTTPVTLGDREIARVQFQVDRVGRVEGRVVDVRGLPVAGAIVTLYSEHPLQRQLSARADDGGRFAFARVAPARYRTWVHEPVWSMGLPDASAGDDADPETLVVARETLTQLELTVVPRPSFPVVGRVVDAEGKPVAGAYVSVEPDDTWHQYDHRTVPRLVQPTVTDRDGWFYAATVRAHHHDVWAYRVGGGLGRVEWLRAGTLALVTIRPPGSIRGTVSAPGGTPSELQIRVEDRDRSWCERVSSASGWQITGLPAGKFSLVASATAGDSAVREIELGPGHTLSGIALDLVPPAAVVGRLVSFETGEPLAGVTVFAMPRDHRVSDCRSRRHSEAVSSADGRFRLVGARSGPSRIVAKPADPWTYVSRPAELAPGQTTDIGSFRVARHAGATQSGTLGLRVSDRAGEHQVTHVEPEGAAAVADVRVGDVITAVDGNDVRGFDQWELGRAMWIAAGESIALTLARGPTVTVVARRPEPAP